MPWLPDVCADGGAEDRSSGTPACWPELNLGNYTDPSANLRSVRRVRHLYDHRRGGLFYLLQMRQRTRCRDRRADRQRQKLPTFSTGSDYNRPLVISRRVLYAGLYLHVLREHR